VEGEKHPALKLPSEERTAYLRVIASMASSDGKVSDSEIAHLREACEEVGLDPVDTGSVIDSAVEPDSAEIDAAIRQLAGSELKFTLLADLLFIAHSDGKYSEEERLEVVAIADTLGINTAQVSAVDRYVAAVLRASKAKGFEMDDLKKHGGEVAAGLVAAGVPIAAVGMSGSVAGLSAAGVTSGLAALGMGLGVTTGIGVVVGIGVASYFGVRWLSKKVTSKTPSA